MEWRGVAVAIALAGCGRFGFDERAVSGDGPVVDAAEADSPTVDSPLVDSPLVDSPLVDSPLVDAPDIDAPDIDAAPLDFVRFPMDDDPAAGTIAAIPAEYSVTCTACPAATGGHIAGAYHFSGAQAFAIDNGALVTSQPFTITLWAFTAVNDGTFLVLFGKPLDNDTVLDVVSLTIRTDIGVPGYESNFNGGISAISDSTDIRGGWHHLALVWDGTARSFFIDGHLAGTLAQGFSDSTLPLQVGSDIDMGSPMLFFQGDLDELRLYRRALDASEIAALLL